MRFKYFLCFLFLLSCSGPYQNLKKNSLDNSGEVLSCSPRACVPSKALLELLSLLNIKHDASLKSIVSATQAAWLRPAGLERLASGE